MTIIKEERDLEPFVGKVVAFESVFEFEHELFSFKDQPYINFGVLVTNSDNEYDRDYGYITKDKQTKYTITNFTKFANNMPSLRHFYKNLKDFKNYPLKMRIATEDEVSKLQTAILLKEADHIDSKKLSTDPHFLNWENLKEIAKQNCSNPLCESKHFDISYLQRNLNPFMIQIKNYKDLKPFRGSLVALKTNNPKYFSFKKQPNISFGILSNKAIRGTGALDMEIEKSYFLSTFLKIKPINGFLHLDNSMLKQCCLKIRPATPYEVNKLKKAWEQGKANHMYKEKKLFEKDFCCINWEKLNKIAKHQFSSPIEFFLGWQDLGSSISVLPKEILLEIFGQLR